MILHLSKSFTCPFLVALLVAQSRKHMARSVFLAGYSVGPLKAPYVCKVAKLQNTAKQKLQDLA